jgi:hypothetical protein
MMTEYTRRLARHPDFVDVAKINHALTGVSLGDHEALTFALFARCNMVTLQGIQQNPWLGVLKEENFYTTAIPRETIHAFFSEFASTASEMKVEIDNGRRMNRDHGANDFTIFRKKPLIAETFGILPTDVLLVTEKFETGHIGG